MSFKFKNVEYQERILVGQILLDEAAYSEAGLTPEHFSHPVLSKIMQTVQKLKRAGKPVDPLLVGDAMKEADLTACGGLAFLTKLTLDISTTSNVGYYADTIRDAWLQRQCAKTSETLSSLSQQEASGDAMLRALREQCDYLGGLTCTGTQNLAEAYQEEAAAIIADKEKMDAGEVVLLGLPDGLGLDRVVPGGIPIGMVTTLFGESGNFKTTTKNNINWGIALSGVGGVLNISLEDSNKLETQRFIARQTAINYGRIATRKLSDNDVETIQCVSQDALDAARQIELGGNLPPDLDRIIDLARELKRKQGIVAVVIDYIQCLNPLDNNPAASLQKTMSKIHRAAGRDQLSYILVSQVNKDANSRIQDKKSSSRPSIEDMFGSSYMKFHSKLSIGVYRPFKNERVPKKNTIPGEPDYTRLFNEHPDGPKIYRNVIELWVEKNVLGESGVCVLTLVNPATGRMVPMPEAIKEFING